MELSQIRFSDCVVIIGDGEVGLTFTQLSQLRGATRTVNITRASLKEVVMAVIAMVPLIFVKLYN